MCLFSRTASYKPSTLVSQLGASLKTGCGKEARVDPLVFPGTEDRGSPLLPTPPPGLAASLAPRNGRVHSWGSAERVLIRRPLLPTFQLWEEG